MLREVLQSVSTSKSHPTDSSVNARLSKMLRLVADTLWRFDLVKADLVESSSYGCINTPIALSPQAPSLVADRHHLVVYELMKKRRQQSESSQKRLRHESSASSTHQQQSNNMLSESLNYGKSSRPEQGLGLALNKLRTLTSE